MNLTRKHLSVCVSHQWRESSLLPPHGLLLPLPLLLAARQNSTSSLFRVQPLQLPSPMDHLYHPSPQDHPPVLPSLPQGRSQELLLGRVSLRAQRVTVHNLRGFRERSHQRGPGAAPLGGGLGLRSPPDFCCCEIGGTRAILAIENTNKYVAINMQLMYNFAEIYEN